MGRKVGGERNILILISILWHGRKGAPPSPWCLHPRASSIPVLKHRVKMNDRHSCTLILSQEPNNLHLYTSIRLF